MNKDNYIFILAGGSGERFWPQSRKRLPKQLLKLFGDKTLIHNTLDRVKGFVPQENIFILANKKHVKMIREEISEILPENIIAEPEKRDTAPAIALGIGIVARKNPEGKMCILPADHLIQDTEKFRECIKNAFSVASNTRSIVTIGAKPTWACPSYGYIERGNRRDILGVDSSIPVYQVKRFREKPNSELAEEFFAAEKYTWNTGMFFWSIPTVFKELTSHAPDLADFSHEIRKASNLEVTIQKQFSALIRTSIDYALLEKSKKVVTFVASFDWDDVGSWTSIAKYLPEDESGNYSKYPVTSLKSKDNIVFQTKDSPHVALFGVHDLIIVPHKDALLICDKNKAHAIKTLIGKLPEELL